MIYCVASNPKVAAYLVDIVRKEDLPAEAVDIFEIKTRLLKEKSGILLLWCPDYHEAYGTVRAFRSAGAGIRLLCLVSSSTRPPRETAKGRANVLLGGADDCQPFPIEPRELAARLSALARRGLAVDEHVLHVFGDVRFNRTTGRLYCPRGAVQFTRTEAACLTILLERRGSLVTSRAIYDYMYDGLGEAQRKIVDVMICKVRRKLAALLEGQSPIITEWGQGFRFEPRPLEAANQ